MVQIHVMGLIYDVCVWSGPARETVQIESIPRGELEGGFGCPLTMSESSPSSSSLPSTSPPSSVPSPALSTLSLADPKDVTENDRQEATRLKAEANRAFICMPSGSNYIAYLLICLLPRRP